MAPRRILIVALALVALALLALVAWVGLDRHAGAIESASRDRDRIARAPASVAEVEAGERAAARGQVAPTTQFSRLPSFTDVTGLRVVVVDAATNEPVPGAEVHAWEDVSGRFGPTTNYEHWMGPDVAAFIAARSASLVADADGAVDLPPARAHRFVTACKGDELGFIEIEARERGLIELVISTNHELRIHVSDPSGDSLAGVRVALYPASDSSLFWDGLTDEHGSCHVADFESLVRVSDAQPGEPVAVRLAMPFEPLVEKWIDPMQVPSTPIELVMPASGGMHVTIVGENHQRVRISGTLFLTSSDSTLQMRLRPDRPTPTGRAPIVDGEARLDGVGLNQDFVLDADLPGTGDTGADVRGPKSAGEIVEVELEFLGNHTLLEGRIVDGSGHPIADTSFDWMRTIDDGRTVKASGHNVFETDHEGRFAWTFQRAANSELGPVAHRVGFLCEVSSAPVRRQATVSFPVQFTGALTDLGDIVVASGPPLVRGRVIDDADHGIADVGVRVVPARDVRQRDSQSVYSSCTTGDDGSFAIFGPCLALDLVLSVRAGRAEPQIIPFACAGGPAEVTVRAAARGSLVGTALIDHDADVEQLSIAFVVPATTPEQFVVADVRRAGDRLGFRIQNVPLSRGQVRFECLTSVPPLQLDVPDVQVLLPREARPPQLLDVDLRGKLPHLAPPTSSTAGEIEIVDRRGNHLENGLLWVWNATDDEALHRWVGGKVEVVEPDVRRIEIWSAGYRAKRLDPAPRSGRVVLDPELEVELRFAIPHELDLPGVTIRGAFSFEAQADGPEAARALDGEASFVLDRDGRALVRLPAGGTFAARLMLSRTGIAGHDDVHDHELAVSPRPLVVNEVDGLQTLSCKVDEASVQAALGELGRSKD